MSIVLIGLFSCKTAEDPSYIEKLRANIREFEFTKPFKLSGATYQKIAALDSTTSEERLGNLLDSLALEYQVAGRSEAGYFYECLSLLRSQRNVVNAVVNKYSGFDKNDYRKRQLLISFAGEMQKTEFRDFFLEIINAPLDNYKVKSETMTATDYEIYIKMKAVHSIAFIRGSEGDPVAEVQSDLINIINNHPLHTIRLEALDAYLWNNNDSEEAKRFLESRIPESYKQFINRTRYYSGRNKEQFIKDLKK